MKNYITKILSVILAVLMVFSTGAVAFAESDDTADTEIVYRYSTIGSTSITFGISGITASCGASLTAQYSTSLKIKMELQKKSNGSYSTIQTWSTSRTGAFVNIGKTKTINPLSTYRLKVTYTAGNETVVRYAYK